MNKHMQVINDNVYFKIGYLLPLDYSDTETNKLASQPDELVD
jgi:hypothetical protein